MGEIQVQPGFVEKCCPPPVNDRSHDRENTTTLGASKDVKGKSSLTPLELIGSQREWWTCSFHLLLSNNLSTIFVCYY